MNYKVGSLGIHQNTNILDQFNFEQKYKETIQNSFILFQYQDCISYEPENHCYFTHFLWNPYQYWVL